MRDGATSYAVMIALEIVTMVYRLTGGIAYVPQCVSTIYVLFDNNVNLSWVMAVLLCVGCRLIINLQRLGQPVDREELAPGPSIELSTRIADSRFTSTINI